MKDTTIFDEHFKKFSNNRFNSNTSEDIKKLETDFNIICSKIEKQGDDEIKKFLEHHKSDLKFTKGEVCKLVSTVYKLIIQVNYESKVKNLYNKSSTTYENLCYDVFHYLFNVE